jgi:hypothetical protein
VCRKADPGQDRSAVTPRLRAGRLTGLSGDQSSVRLSSGRLAWEHEARIVGRHFDALAEIQPMLAGEIADLVEELAHSSFRVGPPQVCEALVLIIGERVERILLDLLRRLPYQSK